MKRERKRLLRNLTVIDIFVNFMVLNSRSVMKFLMKLLPITSIKVSRLERTVDSICKMQIEFPCQANACVIEKLQKDLNFNKKSSELYHRLVSVHAQ